MGTQLGSFALIGLFGELLAQEFKLFQFF